MASMPVTFYRNFTVDDTVTTTYSGIPTVETLGWDNPNGSFVEWNTQRDGSGSNSFEPGDAVDAYGLVLYAIWAEPADVEISYNGNTIASMSDSGTATLETEGKYCSGNITVSYSKPSEGDNMVFLTATGTTDTTLSLTDTSITTVPLTTVVNSGNASGVLSITDNGIKVLENGYYLVFGSIYYAVDSSVTVPIGEGVYIFADSTEMNSTVISQGGTISTAVGITPKILQLNANTTVFLRARQRFSANNGKTSVDNDNPATYLCVVKIL